MANKPSQHGAKTRDKGTVTVSSTYYGLRPAWGFRLFDFEHPKWGLPVSTEITKALLSYLGSLEQIGTWRDVLSLTSGRKNNTRNHFISADKLTADARRRLTERNLDDYNALLSIAISNTERVWGILGDDTGGVF
jgi:hypothetical protein